MKIKEYEVKITRINEVEQRALVQKAQAGDDSSRDALVRDNQGLVFHVAKRFYNPDGFMEMADLLQLGSLGLMKGIQKFDLKRRYGSKKTLISFSTYVTHWITHEIRRGIENHGHTIAIPPYVHQLRRVMVKVNRDMRNTGSLSKGRRPISEKHERLLAIMAKDPIPLEIVTEQEDSQALTLPQETASDNEIAQLVESHVQREWIDELMNGLTDRERFAVRSYYGLEGNKQEKTLQEVGESLGVTRERARQIVSRACRIMKQLAKARLLKTYGEEGRGDQAMCETYFSKPFVMRGL